MINIDTEIREDGLSVSCFSFIGAGRETHCKAKLNSKLNMLLVSICSSENSVYFGMSVWMGYNQGHKFTVRLCKIFYNSKRVQIKKFWKRICACFCIKVFKHSNFGCLSSVIPHYPPHSSNHKESTDDTLLLEGWVYGYNIQHNALLQKFLQQCEYVMEVYLSLVSIIWLWDISNLMQEGRGRQEWFHKGFLREVQATHFIPPNRLMCHVMMSCIWCVEIEWPKQNLYGKSALARHWV